jgi:hypothetical protein
VAGWASQWLTRLSWDRDSGTAPVDVRRVRPEEKPTTVAVEQLKALVGSRPAAQRGDAPLVLFDAGYDAAEFTHALVGTPVALLIRLRSNRHFWFAPIRATAHPRGRPKRRGAKFVYNEPTTWPAPTAELQVTDEVYGPVDVRAWTGLHTQTLLPNSQAAAARATQRETRVGPRGTSFSHARVRMTLTAVAMRSCCRCVRARPR